MPRSRRPARLALGLGLAAVLAFGALVTPAAAAPHDEPDEACWASDGTFNVSAPSAFGFVGVPLLPAPVEVSSTTGPVTWDTSCLELPDGITFDPATASLAGTPTALSEGVVGVILPSDDTGSVPMELWLTVSPASALQVAMTDAAGTPLDPTDLQRGTVFELRGEGLPDGTLVRARLNGRDLLPEPVVISTWEGDYAIPGAIAEDAASGDPRLEVEFTMPSGVQRYTTRVAATVRVLTIGGPTTLTPVAGTAVEYAFPVSGASGDVTYSLDGALPAGLTFDATRGTITGTPTRAAETRDIRITATDARGSVSHGASISVLPATTVAPTIAAFLTAPSIGSSFGQLLDRGLTPEEALDQATRQNRPSTGNDLMVARDPDTGKLTFLTGDAPDNPTADVRLPSSTPRSDSIVVGTRDTAAMRELAAAQSAAALAAVEAKREAELQRNIAAAEAAKAKALEQTGRDGTDLSRAERTRIEQQRQAALHKEQVARKLEAAERRNEDQANQLAELAGKRVAERQAALDRDGESTPLPQGTRVSVEMHSTPVLLGSATVGSTGGFALEVSPPTNLEPGLHHLVVTYTLPDGTVHTSRTPVTVLHPDALLAADEAVDDATTADILPVTGTDAAATAAGALILLILGTGLVIATRRRTAAAPAPISTT